MSTLTVFEKKGNLLVDSREVAIMVEKKHKNLLRDISKYIAVLDGSKLSCQEYFVLSKYLNEQNKEQPCYLITKKGCDLIAHKMTGEKGILFSAEYIDRFYSMEKLLLEKQTSQWVETRAQSMFTRKAETNTVKQFVEYAKRQGSNNAEKLYMTYSRLANTMAGITDRNNATTVQLNALALIEGIALNCIKEEMQRGTNYKVIYQICKTRITEFNNIAYLGSNKK